MSNSYAHRSDSEEYPFLSLQMNSLLRRIKNDDFRPQPAGRPHLFRKPLGITHAISTELPRMWVEQREFSGAWRKQIEAYVKSFGMNLRTTQDKDTAPIKEFLARRYPAKLANEICAFDLYRFRKYGHGVILETDEGKVMGTIFEVGYHTAEHTSYTIRLAIDESLAGKNLGYHVMMYSSLVAMENGSRVKRGLIEFSNRRSLYINLNKVGWVCDGFEPSISELGSFFEICLPLDPMGLTGNVIEMPKVSEYLRTHRAGLDYQIVPADDFESICRMYEADDFKVAAMLKPGIGAEDWSFLAISAEALQLQRW